MAGGAVTASTAPAPAMVAVSAASAAAAAVPQASSPEPTEMNDDGLTIPRPDNVPQRKVSPVVLCYEII